MRLAIDIGGTFTDLCLVDNAGRIHTHKLLTTGQNPAHAFLQILQESLETQSAHGRDVHEVLHATTVATNAILEGKMARLGLVTTSGFRDVLEIGRHFRRNLYTFFIEKPPTLVPRDRRLEVVERIDTKGRVIRPIHLPGLDRVARRLAKMDVEVVLVCFLNSHRNPVHELLAARQLQRQLGVPVLASHALCWECREYERFSTVAVSGAVLPLVTNYVGGLREGLQKMSVNPDCLAIMQSNGGLADVGAVCHHPATIIESGPAAGVIAAAAVGRRIGVHNLIAFDMGGTTAKAALVVNGRVTIRSDFEVGGGTQGGFGTGYPVKLPSVDLVEVGTGGGSICRLSEGRFTVGPDSAGADPGPVCYGRGGRLPTITDAHAVLGRLLPSHFAGGRFELQTAAASKVIERTLARPLGLTTKKAAAGLLSLANQQMVQALRLVTVQRGINPTDFVLIAFGGAGPLHAADLLRELGGRRAVIPPEAGVQSAWGLLVAERRRDFQHSWFGELNPSAIPSLTKMFSKLRTQALTELDRSNVPVNQVMLKFGLDLRYQGQAYEITVESPKQDLDIATIGALADRFHDRHRTLYGFVERHRPIECTVVRLTATAPVTATAEVRLKQSRRSLKSRMLTTTRAYFEGRFHTTPVYDRQILGPKDHIRGPAIIVQSETTTVIPPWARVEVGPAGDLMMELT